MTWRNAESVPSIESVDDDALTLILTALPAHDARAAFSVSKRFSAHAACAREKRLRLYWCALFRSEVGFPSRDDIALLTAADVYRFEARISNMSTNSTAGAWRCLSCLQPSPLRVGDFCADCVGNEAAFVKGNGGYIMSDVTCGHRDLVYWCALCEASSCRNCLMGGACTFCLLLAAPNGPCGPCEPCEL